MKPGSTTDIFLRRQRRRARGTLLAWSVAVAVFARAWSGAVELGWLKASGFWGLVPAAVAGWLLVRWVRRVWRLNTLAVAREVDARWELGARLESAVELSGDDSAVAVAQRTDAAQQLATKKPAGTMAWVAGIAAALICAGVVAVEYLELDRRAHLPRPVALPVVAQPRPKAPPAPPPPPPEPLRAALSWKSPEHQITAKPAAEIPLVAHADSNKGFRSMVLAVAVNGTPTNSTPVAAAALGTLGQPGEGDVKLSLFLDETGAKPCDIVSYYLQAAANVPPDFPAVVSPLQFIEVTPVDAPPGGDERFGADARELLRRIKELKQSEVELIEKNFNFAHAAPAGPVIDVTPEHAAAATAQAQLAPPTDEARALAGRIKAPDLVIADLAQAAPAMIQAGERIGARDHAAAAPLQARALAAIADAERVFRQALETQMATAKPDAVAVAATAASIGELPPRDQTPAGRLEQLARRQGENNRRLQQLAFSVGLPAIAAEQAAIARALEKLAGERALVTSVQKTVDNALKATAEAARQLGLNDAQAARLPAAEAQALLQHAVEAQESEGRRAASELLEQVRQELNDAERLSARAEQQARQEQIQRQVNTEAQRQQRQGSTEAARKLDALAQKLKAAPAGSPSPPPEKKPDQGEKPTPAKDPPAPANGQVAKGQPGGGKESAVYVAELRPLASAASKGSGRATITLKADQSIAKLDVTLTGLGSRQTHAFLAVGGTGAQGTAVLPLESGSIAGKYWRFEPAGGFSREALVAALESGNLYLQVDTTALPEGELGGQFLVPPKTEGGNPDQPPPPREPQPTDYDADLWPLPGASVTTATGNAGIRLSENKALATINVLFSHLSSAETGAYLKVGGAGDDGAPVFTVGLGHFTGKSWRFDPVGTYTRADLVTALESGKLYLEIDTANFPKGELGGQFTRKAGDGAGSGSGGGGGPSTGGGSRDRSQAAGVSMPTLGADAGVASALVAAAVTAAESQVALAPDNSLAQTIRQLKAATNKLAGGTGRDSSLSLLETAAQKAQLLATDPRLAGVAREIAQAAGGQVDGKEPLDAAALQTLADHADELVKALEEADRPGTKRDEWVRRYAPEEIDPDYRKPVEDYFERLSREGAAR